MIVHRPSLKVSKFLTRLLNTIRGRETYLFLHLTFETSRSSPSSRPSLPGATRLERGEHWVKYLTKLCRGFPELHTIDYVPGVGHDGGAM